MSSIEASKTISGDVNIGAHFNVAGQPSLRRKSGALAALLAYFAFVHVALAQGWSRAAIAALVLLVCVSLWQRARTPARRQVTAAAGAAVLTALAALPDSARLEWMMFLPPLAINGLLCWVFGRTLVRGRVPIAAVFARHARGGDLPPELLAYTWQITIAWTVFFAVMLATAASLTAFGSLSAWSWFANFANPLLVGAFFVCEYGWRLMRFRHHRHTSLADMLQYLRMPAIAAEAKPLVTEAKPLLTEAKPLLTGTQPLAAAQARSMLPLLRLHRPDDPVAWQGGQAITAAQLIDAATALAGKLPPGRHVLNLCRDRYRFVAGFAAAMIAGRVTLLPSSQGEAAIRDICSAFPDVCCLADHDEVPAGVATLKVTVTCSDEVHAPAPPAPAFPGGQQAAIVFTSGSTGAPTPHLKTWESLVRGALTLGAQLGMGAAASNLRPAILGTVPPQHMFGLETTVMLPLQWRGAFGAGRPLLPSDIGAGIRTLPEPRWLMTTPLHLHACVRDGLDLTGTLTGIISSTMPLEETLAKSAEALCGCVIQEIYGATETGMLAMRRTASGPTWTLCDGLSMVVEGQAMRIEGGHVVPPFTLGDRIEPVGERSFRLLGRAEDLIKVAGKRASLEALNARLRALPGVADGVFYFPRPAGNAAARPVAFAVAPGATAGAIIAALRRDLDPVFLPRPLYLVAALPRADNGKITEEGLEDLLRQARTGRFHSVSEPAV